MWTKSVDTMTAKSFPISCAVDGKIYVIGGYKGVNISDVEEFDTGIIDPESVDPSGKLPQTWGTLKAK